MQTKVCVVGVGPILNVACSQCGLWSNPPDLRSVSDIALNPWLRRSKRE